MDYLIKGSVIGITAAIIGLLLKKSNPEMTILLSAASAVLILFFALSIFLQIKGFIDELADYGNISSALIIPVFKCVGIAVVAKLASDVCKDAGYSACASAVELVAAVSAMYAALPLMRTVIGMMESLI